MKKSLVVVMLALGPFAAGCHSSDARKDAGSGSIQITGGGGSGMANGDGGPGPGPDCGVSLYEAPPTAVGNLSPSGNLAVDALALYWVDEVGRVLRLPKAGGTPQVLATQVAGMSPMARNVALSDDAVYFTDATDTGFIKRVAKGGGEATTLLTTHVSVDAIHLDASWIYWRTAWQAGSPVWRAPRDGGDPIALADWLDLTATPSVNYIDVDDESIYFTVDKTDSTDGGAVYRLAKDGSAATAIASGVDEPWNLTAADPDFLYFDIGGFSYVAATAQFHVGKIGRVPKHAAAATVPEILASNQHGPANLVRDGDSLYWIDSGGGPTPETQTDSTLMRLAVPAAGHDAAVDGGAADGGGAGPLSLLAACRWGSQSIAVDESSVYYLDWHGGIRKVAK
jgi:hypothetical protein